MHARVSGVSCVLSLYPEKRTDAPCHDETLAIWLGMCVMYSVPHTSAWPISNVLPESHISDVIIGDTYPRPGLPVSAVSSFKLTTVARFACRAPAARRAVEKAHASGGGRSWEADWAKVSAGKATGPGARTLIGILVVLFCSLFPTVHYLQGAVTPKNTKLRIMILK